MDNLPQDPAMLLSYINMKLRDDYDSLDDPAELTARMAAAGFEYSAENKRFW